MDRTTQEALARLPKVDRLLDRCESHVRRYGRAMVVEAIRAELDFAREHIQAGAGTEASPESLAAAVDARLDSLSKPSLRKVLNATGVILHTNLGRAPLAETALDAIAEVARGYSNLEYDAATGERGSRYAHVQRLLQQLTGAEAALVVNNNAAAVTLAVNTFARDGEVVTSRGELVEIGGSFRIPDVIERSEAAMREVGTTNRTRPGDYRDAITEHTRILLKVHPSNYRVVGFSESVSREDIVAVAHEHGLLAIEDLGSGTLVDLAPYGLPGEPTVQEVLAAGLDIVTFSGDKLLGGPQCGIVAGRAECIERMQRNPLLRALRIDKLSLAALEATLRLYMNLDAARDTLPALRMLTEPVEAVRERAGKLSQALAGISAARVETVDLEGRAGGGTLPEQDVPSAGVRLRAGKLSAHTLHERLRTGETPVVARIEDEWIVFDLRTVATAELDLLIQAVRSALA